MKPRRTALVGLIALLLAGGAATQQGSTDPDAAWTFDTYTPGPCSPIGAPHGGCERGKLIRIRVSTVAHGLIRPWHLSFLPDGDMLVTELPGSLRIVRDGRLDPEPVGGWPAEALAARSMNSVVLHPQFERNDYLYVSYTKQRGPETTVALARARYRDRRLSDVSDVFVADAWGTGAAAGRAEFGPDGMIYLTVGDRDGLVMTEDSSQRMHAQRLDNHVGKILRLRDNGSVPEDNPFVGQVGAKPEIYSYGHRNAQGLAWHPDTGDLWATEIGPMGGDELNLIVPGANYGWPLVSLGKYYTGNRTVDLSWYRPGMEMPVMFWVPAISPSSLMIYSGKQFPDWKGHFFVGALSGQQLQRVAFNQPLPQQERRESLLTELDARVRDVREGPDDNLYVLVERDLQAGPGSARLTPDGSVLRIEPVQ